MRAKRNCLHCGVAFIPRFGREQCCSKSCAAFVREGHRPKKQGKKITANDYLRGAF